jgi:hypothetical protein
MIDGFNRLIRFDSFSAQHEFGAVISSYPHQGDDVGPSVFPSGRRTDCHQHRRIESNESNQSPSMKKQKINQLHPQVQLRRLIDDDGIVCAAPMSVGTVVAIHFYLLCTVIQSTKGTSPLIATIPTSFPTLFVFQLGLDSTHSSPNDISILIFILTNVRPASSSS